MATIGELAVSITARTQGFDRGVAAVSAGTSAMGVSLSGIASSVLKFEAAIAAAGAAAVTAFAGWGVKLAAEAEMAEAGFTVLLKSAESAKTLLGKIKAFADVTPFEQADLRKSAQTLLAYGVSAQNIMPALKMLGDVSMGSAEKMASLTLAFGQIVSKGRLQGGELRQLTEQGFNPLAMIAAKAGKSMSEMTAIMEDGGVSAAQVVEALAEATSGTGLFAGAMDKQAQTVMGRFSTLKDGIATEARKIGEALMPAIKSAMDVVSSALTAAGPGFSAVLQTIGEEISSVFGGVDFSATIKGALGVVDIFVASTTAAFQGLANVAKIAAAVVLEYVATFIDGVAKVEDIGKRVLGARGDFGVRAFSDANNPAMRSFSDALADAGREGLSKVTSGEAFSEMMRKIGEARERIGKDTGGTEFDTFGLDGAKEKLEKIKDTVTKVKEEAIKAASPIAAVSKGSTAGFSAIQSSKRENGRRNEVAEKSLAEEKKAVAELKGIRVAVSKLLPIKLEAATI